MKNYLIHHGIQGQKWGVRRFQNSDGTLTNAGKHHYSTRENYKNSVKEKNNHQSENLKSLKNNLIYEGVSNTGKFALRTGTKLAISKGIEKYKIPLILASPLMGLTLNAVNKPIAALSIGKDFINTMSMNISLKEIYDERKES